MLPAGLGIFGAAFQYHLHYLVLGLGCVFNAASSTAIVPVTTNYIIECFPNHVSGVAAIMNLYRFTFADIAIFRSRIDGSLRPWQVPWYDGVLRRICLSVHYCADLESSCDSSLVVCWFGIG